VVAVSLTLLAMNYGGYGSDTTAALAIAVWWLVALGLGFDLLPRQRLAMPGVVAFSALLGLTAFTALSIIWADDAGKAYIEGVQMAAMTGVFVAALLFVKRGEGRAWLAGMSVGLGVIVFLALVSRFFPELGDDRELTAQLGSIVGGRLSWPLGYWNAVGTVAAFFAVLTVWFSASARSRVARSVATATVPGTALVLYLCSSRGALAALAAGLILLIGVGPRRLPMIASLTLGLVGAVVPVILATGFHDLVHAQASQDADAQGVTLMVVTVLATLATFAVRYLGDRPIDRTQVSRKISIAGLVAVVIVALVGVIALDPVEKFDSFTAPPTSVPSLDGKQTYATEHLLGSGGNGRWQLWKSALSAFESEPLTGIGAGGFSNWFKLDGDIWMKTIDAHSTPLQILGELGAIGFLLLALFSLTVVVIGVSRLRIEPSAQRLSFLSSRAEPDTADRPDAKDLSVVLAVLLTGLVSLSIDWTGEFPVVFIPLLICAALISGQAYSLRPIPDGNRLSTVAAILLILVSGAFIYGTGRQYIASSKVESSRDLYDEGRPEAAFADARDAIDATPWWGAPYSQAAAILHAQGVDRAALDYSIEATEKAPVNDAMWLQRAKIEMTLDETEAAKASRDEARKLNPKAPIWHRSE